MRLSGKNIFTTVLSFICLCFITSCSFVSDVAQVILSIPSLADWNGETQSVTYNGTEVQYEVSASTRTLELQINESVDIFMVKMNESSTVIPAISTRYIVSARAQSSTSSSSRSAFLEASLGEITDWENVSGITSSGFIRKDFAPARDFVPPALDSIGSGRSAMAASVVSEPMKAVTPITPIVGTTEKNLWVDVPKKSGESVYSYTVSGTSYTKRKATLRASGTNCYVWVLDDNFTIGSASGDKITQAEAEELAEKFDSMYDLIKEVFGPESGRMISANGSHDIKDVSDTGTKVNIVVYDIRDDYESNDQSGIAGYFWAKDYYTSASASYFKDNAISLSNDGKYFYVDSGYLNKYPNMIYSTLAHEFQHMINFGQKTMKSMENATKQSDIVSSSTWSNEMMSMVCEDMIQKYLGIDLLDSPVYRLLDFAQGYYRSGLTDWFQDSNVAYSYAGAYAFGAYLARNYGGTSLIKQIATNQYVDQQAITQALQAIGKNESFETVFKKYPQALLLDNAPTGVPSFNKSVQGIGGGMMSALNLFTMVVQDDKGNTYSFKPSLMNTTANARVNLRPYGFTLHSVVSTASAGMVNITFSSPVSTNEKIYILVQPCNHNHEKGY